MSRFPIQFVLAAFLCAPTLANETGTIAETGTTAKYLGPTEIVVPSGTDDPGLWYVLCEDAGRVMTFRDDVVQNDSRFDRENVAARGMTVNAGITALVSGDEQGQLHVGPIDAMTMLGNVGHTPVSPVFSGDGKTLYVPCRFSNDVAVIDVAKTEIIARIPMVREPIAAALTPDGATLVVVNHLPAGRADTYDISATVSLVDTKTRDVTHVRLLNGSTGLRDVAISPDGKYAYIPHILARYQMPTTQLERGWMNTNALSIFDIVAKKLLNTVLLDDVDRGAAIPWGVAVSDDGNTVVVTHAATHEASVIDMAGVLRKIAETPEVAPPYDSTKPYDDQGSFSSLSQADIPNDLAFLVGLRTRVPLPVTGPRGVAIIRGKAYIAGYFSDAIAVIDLGAEPLRKGVTKIVPGPEPVIDQIRQGEILFSDAALCFQNWQSCTSCHPDARTDGLNWDLMNDGFGNPKNNRSMLLAHETAPAMWTAVRPTAEHAVRSGIRHIQMAVRPDEDAQAIDAYLKSLRPVPSPKLVDGKLSEAAERGKIVFEREHCDRCHPAPLFTDCLTHDVKTGTKIDRCDEFDTPTLVEVWRTAPYIHDGRFGTMREVFEVGLHGLGKPLSESDLNDLVEYVDSL
ncbi:MAG: cell surface protein [Planctomycetia bacterium]|nr:cell surface protein [Planctomycetia bacterium]